MQQKGFVRALSLALIFVFAVGAQPTMAQQDVPFNMGIPVAPSGLVPSEIGDGPWIYRTGEDMTIVVSVLTKDIEYPWSLAFVGDNDLLVTTRGGTIRRIVDDQLLEDPVAGGPESFFAGVSGLPGAVHGYMDLVPHPDFDSNGLLYLSYTKPVGERTVLGIGRGRWTGSEIADFEDIYVSAPGSGGPSRIVFGLDGTLYFSASGGNSQTLDNIGGKVLRINDDGSIPDDNPFVDQRGARPEIFTIGHRNTLGLAVDPTTGVVWQNENGPNGGDEVNVLEPGGNYGWPIVSLGRDYQGGWASREFDGPTHEGFIPPSIYWMPAIAVSGMVWYTGDALPKWKGDLFAGGLRYGEIFGTGRLTRILVNEEFQELRREDLLLDLHQRIRDVRQ
ncbi:MAG TPA: PQQ-dependent sugar dehydrogenase, partial [Gammaproteobacteria bacterium]|nr:PQQ-dependent sugar dehydrogenase [Gammaproteobacteria bacterium]